MKTLIFSIVFMALSLVTVYGGGTMELVNVQEFSLENTDTIIIRYRVDHISVFPSETNSFILKEYMNTNNSNFMAEITNSNGVLLVEAGPRPLRPLFNSFSRRIEIYIPVLSDKNITIITSTGRIEANDVILASSLSIESSTGRISVNNTEAQTISLKAGSGNIGGDAITGNMTIQTNAGNINFGIINGNVSATSSSGSINLGLVNGGINARSTTGSFSAAITENARDISITTSTGRVNLNIPRSLTFNFSSRTSTGSLRTPFAERLSSPVSDRRLVEGNIDYRDISANQVDRSISINTGTGSINVNWLD